jgi:hypothetical protein
VIRATLDIGRDREAAAPHDSVLPENLMPAAADKWQQSPLL